MSLDTLIKYADEHFSMSLESMADLKIELIWLYTYLEIKGDESKRRGKPPSKEYEQSIQTVKRASLFISTYCAKLEQMDAAMSELNRQLDYYKSKLPHVNISKTNIHWDGNKLIYA